MAESIRSEWCKLTLRGRPAPGRVYGLPPSGRHTEAPAVEAAEDARTLPVLRKAAGERCRDVKSVAAVLSEVEFPDWPLEGPRTTKWW